MKRCLLSLAIKEIHIKTTVRYLLHTYWGGYNQNDRFKELPTVATAAAKLLQSCLTLWDPVACRTLGFRVHHRLQGLAQTHVHRISDAIQPS